AVLAESFARAPRMRTAFVAQVALRRAVLQPEPRRIAEASRARCVRMAHEHHMPRLPQQLPGLGLGERWSWETSESKQNRGDHQHQPHRNSPTERTGEGEFRGQTLQLRASTRR